MQHARNRTVVNRLIGIHRVGIILLDLFIHFGELLKAVAHIGFGAGRGRRGQPLGKQHAEESEQRENENDCEERTTRTTSHASISFGRELWRGPATASWRKYSMQTSVLLDASSRPRLPRFVKFI